MTSQAAKIQQSSEQPVDGDAAADGQDSSAHLAQVCQFLRQQEEILETQLQIEKTEKSRLAVKLEHTERNLDEVRAQLTEVCLLSVTRN